MSVIDYLLNSESFVEYATRINLLREDKTKLSDLRKAVLADERIKLYLNDICDCHSAAVKTHKNPELAVNKLIFLLELGLDRDVHEIDAAVNAILAQKDENGVFQSLVNIPKHFGGSGEDTFGWALCDAPNMMIALLMAGVPYAGEVEKTVKYLTSLIRDNGFPCAVSEAFGTFRGPGRKDDCCPYATLNMLKMYSLIPECKDSSEAKRCIDVLLNLWETSRDQHPYMFFMGTDFRKLKAPVIWYDILHVVDVLSRFESAVYDARFKDMLEIIEAKEDADGMYTPESVYLKCKDFDFGQKKVPSAYLTYRCMMAIERTHQTQNKIEN